MITSIKCAVCGQHFEAHNVSLLDEKEEFWVLRVSCSTCQTECLVAVMVSDSTTPEMVTDFTEIDLTGLSNRHDVTTDDMLDMHNFLNDFNGDFSRLFKRN